MAHTLPIYIENNRAWLQQSVRGAELPEYPIYFMSGRMHHYVSCQLGERQLALQLGTLSIAERLLQKRQRDGGDRITEEMCELGSGTEKVMRRILPGLKRLCQKVKNRSVGSLLASSHLSPDTLP